MRHFLVDTDTAGDDAIALMMMLQEPQVRAGGGDHRGGQCADGAGDKKCAGRH